MVDDILQLDDDTQEEIMRSYEYIRQSGLTNMYNTTNVRHIAQELNCVELLDLMETNKGYASILKNYSSLIKKFGISREHE